MAKERAKHIPRGGMPHGRIGTVEAIVTADSGRTERVVLAELFDPALLEACWEITPTKTISLSKKLRRDA